jgi:hypothetical protein
MEALAVNGAVAFRTEGTPPDFYHVMITGAGLALDAEHRLAVRDLHRCDAYLHRDYPRRPPVITWLTPIFHPNILGPDRNGGVCIGSWSAAEGLADLIVRLRNLVTYRAFNADDALNPRAASWVVENRIEAGCEVAALAGQTVCETEIALRGSSAVR